MGLGVRNSNMALLNVVLLLFEEKVWAVFMEKIFTGSFVLLDHFSSKYDSYNH